MFKKICFVTLFASSAYAAPAVVINDMGCGLLDGNGYYAFATSDHTVVTSNGAGVLKCSAKAVPNSSGQAVFFNYENTGATCGTSAGETYDWNIVVSAAGNATLTCIVH